MSAAGWARWVFGAQVLSTGAMFGLIWFVQLVHYPLFLRIQPDDFVAWETEHANRTGYVAGPLMVVELGSACLLLWSRLRPEAISQVGAAWGAALALATWVSTFAVQVPLHNRLHRGFDRQAIERLVATNWLRTVLWTARAGLVAYWAVRG